MPSVSRHVVVEAPRAAVWATLADLGAVSVWNPAVDHSAETADEAGPAGVGSARHCELPGSMGAVDEVVTDWQDQQSMELEVRGARMMRSMRARYDLETVGAGTQVTMSSEFRMAFGPIGALMAATMGKRLIARTMDQTLGGLKAHVETMSAPPDSPAPPSSEPSSPGR